MKNHFKLIVLLIITFIFCSCNIQDKKPFGAEVIDYDKVEGINKTGPTMDDEHTENKPPVSDKTTFVETGPPHIEYPDIKVEPTADLDEDPDYGGIPVVKKDENVNGS